MRSFAAPALLLIACTGAPRSVIVVSPGTELVCVARGAPSRALDASVVAPVDGATVDVAVDASRDAAVDDVEATDVSPTPPRRRTLALDLAHAALLPEGTHTLRVVQVARCIGARALVVTDGGRIEAWPLPMLRAPRFAEGAEVMAHWQGGPSAYHAVVTAAHDQSVQLRYDDGSHETLDASRLESVRLAEVPPTATGVCAGGGEALPVALVESERWRRVAAVIECGAPEVLVDTLDEGRHNVALAGLSRFAPATGDRVMVRWRDDHDWLATVRSARGDALDVTYEDQSEETVALGQIVALARGAGREPSAFRCP